jgi:hypothetical protein
MRGVLDPSVWVFSLSLYRHPFIYTLFSSHFTLIKNNSPPWQSVPIISGPVHHSFHSLPFGTENKNQSPVLWETVIFLSQTRLCRLLGQTTRDTHRGGDWYLPRNPGVLFQPMCGKTTDEPMFTRWWMYQKSVMVLQPVSLSESFDLWYLYLHTFLCLKVQQRLQKNEDRFNKLCLTTIKTTTSPSPQCRYPPIPSGPRVWLINPPPNLQVFPSLSVI